MEYYKNVSDYWNDICEKHADPRTTNWFFMNSPIPSTLVCTAYFIFVLNGKRIMANREPFDIKNILIVYNFTMVILSGYLVYEFLAAGWWFDYSFGCQPVDYSFSPKAVRMASVCWVFLMSKYIELLDTVFFILRKKFNQVSFLHVFHHGVMPTTWWVGVKFLAGGFGTFHGLINAFIHFVMYSYYGLSACGEKYQKYLWWKKYITQLQMIQFIAVIIHSCQLFFIECNYPKAFAMVFIIYASIFLILFANFFIQEYIKKKNRVHKEKNTKKAN